MVLVITVQTLLDINFRTWRTLATGLSSLLTFDAELSMYIVRQE